MDHKVFNNKHKQSPRTVLKLGIALNAAASGSLLVLPTPGGAQTGGSSRCVSGSRHLEPFIEAQSIPAVMQEVALNPPPVLERVPKELGWLSHQAYSRLPPQHTYAVVVRPVRYWFHPHLPEQDIWGYDSIYPAMRKMRESLQIAQWSDRVVWSLACLSVLASSGVTILTVLYVLAALLG